MYDDYVVKNIVKILKADEFYKKYSNPELVRNLCKACPRYNNVFSCPPFDFDVEKFFVGYKYIKVKVTQVTFGNELRKTQYSSEELENMFQNTFYKEEIIVKEELRLEEEHYDNAISITGPCKICGFNCRKEFDKCIHPDKMRYSLDGMNINITLMLEDLFDINLEFIDENIPKTMNSVNVLLYS